MSDMVERVTEWLLAALLATILGALWVFLAALVGSAIWGW